MPEHRTTRTLATPVLARDSASRYIGVVKLLLDNLPAKLQSQRDTLAQCLEAMDRVLPLKAVYLFGSHARGEADPTATWTCALWPRELNGSSRRRSRKKCFRATVCIRVEATAFSRLAPQRRCPSLVKPIHVSIELAAMYGYYSIMFTAVYRK